MSKLYNSGLLCSFCVWVCTFPALISLYCGKKPQVHLLEAGHTMLQSSPGLEQLGAWWLQDAIQEEGYKLILKAKYKRQNMAFIRHPLYQALLPRPLENIDLSVCGQIPQNYLDMQDSFISYLLVSLTAAWDLQKSKKWTERINDPSCFNGVSGTGGPCAVSSLSCKLCVAKHETQHTGPACPSEQTSVRDLSGASGMT